MLCKNYYTQICMTRAAVVHLNFQAGSTFPVPVCSGVQFYNLNNTPILNMKPNIYEFRFFFEDFVFPIQKILKYP